MDEHDREILIAFSISGSLMAAIIAGIYYLPKSNASVEPPKLPDFHSYVDLSQFCADAGLGPYALGYRQEKPWVDQVLCIGPEGIHEVNATVNGAKVTKIRVTATKGDENAYWVNTPMLSNVALLDHPGHACPNGEKPLAIIAAEASVTGYGTTITRGHPLCMMDGDLVLMSNAPPEQKRNDIVDRWTNFTPTL